MCERATTSCRDELPCKRIEAAFDGGERHEVWHCCLAKTWKREVRGRLSGLHTTTQRAVGPGPAEEV